MNGWMDKLNTWKNRQVDAACTDPQVEIDTMQRSMDSVDIHSRMWIGYAHKLLGCSPRMPCLRFHHCFWVNPFALRSGAILPYSKVEPLGWLQITMEKQVSHRFPIHLKLLVEGSKVILFWWFPIFPLQHPNVHISYISRIWSFAVRCHIFLSPHLNLSATMISPSNISSTTPSYWCESTAIFLLGSRFEPSLLHIPMKGVSMFGWMQITVDTLGEKIWWLAIIYYLLGS